MEGNEETATVVDLFPWTEYEFRVTATNTLGTGEPSSPSAKHKTLQAGKSTSWYTTLVSYEDSGLDRKQIVYDKQVWETLLPFTASRYAILIICQKKATIFCLSFPLVYFQYPFSVFLKITLNDTTSILFPYKLKYYSTYTRVYEFTFVGDATNIQFPKKYLPFRT